jgi:hypothetical protein
MLAAGPRASTWTSARQGCTTASAASAATTPRAATRALARPATPKTRTATHARISTNVISPPRNATAHAPTWTAATSVHALMDMTSTLRLEHALRPAAHQVLLSPH